MLVERLSGAFMARARPGLCTEAVLLRQLERGPLEAKELWRHGRVSKRAMKTILHSAARREMVAIEGDTVRLVASLPHGTPAECPPLEALVSRFELEHPHFPVPYGTADPTFAAGGRGVDWKPVPRESTSKVETLSMASLLSQALVAFAIEYERERRGPIQWAANLLRGVSDDGQGLPPMPRRGTHSVQNLERLRIVTVGRDKTVRLTAIGRMIRDAFDPLCEQVEARWRHQFGSLLIDEVIDAVRVEGEWRPFPLIAWSGGEFSVVARGA